MIPIGDSTPRRSVPWVNYGIVVLTVLLFLFELSLGSGLDAFINRLGVTPAYITAALRGSPRVPDAVFLTLLTSLFLHAGWMHLIGNMLFLWIFGDNVEDRLGHLRYLLFYLLCGVGAGLAQVAVAPTSQVPLIGASGAIAGVLGAYFVFFPHAWVRVLIPIFFFLWPIDLPVILMLGFWFVSQLASGVAAITQVSLATGGVAWWAHVGGFLFGVVLQAIIPKRPEARRWERSTVAADGCPSWLRRTVTFATDVASLLIVARVALLLVAPQTALLPGSVERLVFGLSTPLVGPFSHLLPAVRIDGSILELYALLALLAYQLLAAVTLWFLSAVCRPRTSYYPRNRFD